VRDGHLNLEVGTYLACLREAPPPEALRRAGAPMKAGICDLEFACLPVGREFLVVCALLYAL